MYIGLFGLDNITTYIALLRGINVGGYRPLRMADLREMFGLMGFENVSTYIQSGNVIFDAPGEDSEDLADIIQKQIENTFGYGVPVIICPATYLKTVFEQFPFEEKEGWKGYITFLSNQPSQDLQDSLEAQSSKIETFSMGNRVVYVHVDKQANEKPLFSSSFIQKQLNVPATNRNLRSVKKILRLAGIPE